MPSKMKDYRGMSDEQLGLTLRDTEKHLVQLRFQSATDRLETPSEIRKARREVARIRTVQRQRELEKLGAMSADQLAPLLTNLAARAEGPGKRTVHRKTKRLQAMHAAKAKPAAKPVAAAGGGKK